MKKYEGVANRYVPRILRSLPFQVASWSLMQAGVWHDTYVLKGEDGYSFVLKLPTKAYDVWEKHATRERWLLKKLSLESTGFAPAIVYSDVSKKMVPFSFHVLAFVEGDHLQKTPADLDDLASALRAMHQMTFPKWGGLPPRKSGFTIDAYFEYRFSDQIVRLSTSVQKRLRPVFAEIRAGLRSHRCRSVFCLTHGDVNVRNTLRTESGALVFIDWEMADVCPPARDLADLFVIERFTPRQRERFLKMYGDASPQLEGEIRAFERLTIFAELLDDLESGTDVLNAIQRDVLIPVLKT